MMDDTSIYTFLMNKLVQCSLETDATSVAIRISQNCHRIVVIDNGTGLSLPELEALDGNLVQKLRKGIFENVFKLFRSVRAIASTVLLMTKQNDSTSYVKVFKPDISTVMTMTDRPTHGMTIIVDFSAELTRKKLRPYDLKIALAFLALNHPKVSFSIHDTDSEQTIFGIKKMTRPFELLEIIIRQQVDVENIHFFKDQILPGINIVGYFGYDLTINNIQKCFFNNEQSDSVFIEKIIKNTISSIMSSNSNEKKSSFALNFNYENLFFIIYVSFFSEHESLNTLNDFVDLYSGKEISHCLQRCFVEAIETKIKPWTRMKNMNIIPHGKLKRLTNKTENLQNNMFNYSKNCSIEYFTKSDNVPFEMKNDEIENIQSPEPVELSKLAAENTESLDVSENTQLPTINVSLKSEIRENCNEGKLASENTESSDASENTQNSTINVESLKSEIHKNCNQFPETTVKTDFNHLIENDSTYNSFDSEDWVDWLPSSLIQSTVPPQKNYSFLPATLINILNSTASLSINHLLLSDSVELSVQKSDGKDLRGAALGTARRYDRMVRPCQPKSSLCELTLTKSLLNNIKVLNQVDRRFIAATTTMEETMVLILIDQHAMDERIRYESLLRNYRNDQNNFKPTHLNRPIEISEVSRSIVDSIVINKSKFLKYGMDVLKKNIDTLSLLSIPKCLAREKDSFNLARKLQNLVFEISEILVTNKNSTTVPVTIHDAIASEACHGAIKFGDVLNVTQSEALISHWISTDLPNRCAHGRPVLIPLMTLNS